MTTAVITNAKDLGGLRSSTPWVYIHFMWLLHEHTLIEVAISERGGNVYYHDSSLPPAPHPTFSYEKPDSQKNWKTSMMKFRTPFTQTHQPSLLCHICLIPSHPPHHPLHTQRYWEEEVASLISRWLDQRRNCFSRRNKSVLFGNSAVITTKKLSVCTIKLSKRQPIFTFSTLSQNLSSRAFYVNLTIQGCISHCLPACPRPLQSRTFFSYFCLP